MGPHGTNMEPKSFQNVPQSLAKMHPFIPTPGDKGLLQKNFSRILGWSGRAKTKVYQVLSFQCFQEVFNKLGFSAALTSRPMSKAVSAEVHKQFRDAKESGIDGVICPPSEISKTKDLFDLIVTPGIRLKDEEKNDQKNVSTPEFAINSGAKYIVMGRTIRNNLDFIINELKL